MYTVDWFVYVIEATITDTIEGREITVSEEIGSSLGERSIIVNEPAVNDGTADIASGINLEIQFLN